MLQTISEMQVGPASENGYQFSTGMAEAVSKAPRSEMELQGTLKFYPGQYRFEWLADGKQHYKFVTGAAVRAAFSVEPLDSGWLAPNVMRWGESALGTYALLWTPPGMHTIQFEKERLTVPLPGLIFFGIGRTYFVWAVKAKTFEPNASLWYAPLPNLHPDGRVCWGENKVPECSGAAIGEAWRLFMSSQFNSDLSSGKSRKFPNSIEGQLSFLHNQNTSKSPTSRSRPTRYPEKDLMPFRSEYNPFTAETALQRLAEGGSL